MAVGAAGENVPVVWAIGIDGDDVWIIADGSAPTTLPPAEARRRITEIERAENPRWIVGEAARTYPKLRQHGIRLDRCHDLTLVEGILIARAGRYGEPTHIAAAHARAHGTPPELIPAAPAHTDRPTLFGDEEHPPDVILEVYADQQRRLAADPAGNALNLLTAADSVGALLAVEMTEAGIPWDTAVHDAILTDLLGARTPPGSRPPKLAALADQISAAFEREVNPDSPADVLAAFARDGIELPTTRRWVLRGIDHPAVPALLEYKELARVHTANGWAWLHTWVRDRRFRPEYVPAGVVTGRWATRGGGALQIPRRLRRAVVADPGMTLVVADAAQLEPRVLAAMSRDPGMMRAAGADDLYAALAAESFGGDRAKAKLGLLGAMYGQVGGDAAAPLQVLRARYPVALALLEDAARAGERGGLVQSHLGRTSPPRTVRDPTPAQERARGRFTRNFVVQATAAEWAESLLALLRQRLYAAYGDSDEARIVFYQHDEVMVHCRREVAGAVRRDIEHAAADASTLLFGDTPVVFGLDVRAADSYADAH